MFKKKMSLQWNEYLYTMCFIFSGEKNTLIFKTAFAKGVMSFFKLRFNYFEPKYLLFPPTLLKNIQS